MPFCVRVAAKVSIVEVALETLLNVAPPFVLNCHCTDGVGDPLAATKVTGIPATFVWFVGLAVTRGGEVTVRTAFAVVADPTGLVNTAR